MNVIPGEPVPPGFEDEVNRQAQIQASIDQYKGNALIGIEYTIELHEDERHEPGYLCTLCDKRGDPRTIMNHWCSFNHRMKYLEKHYPSAVRECQPVKYKPNSHNIMILIVQSLAEAIEDHYGRLQVSVMNADEFRKRKTAITEQVMKKQHFDEKSGPNFLNAIDRTLWEQKVTTKKDANVLIKAPKRLNINPAATGNGKAKLTVKDGLDEISSDDDNQDSAKKQKISRGQEIDLLSKKSAAETEKKLPTPKELSLQASHIAQERYKWEKYRCMLEIQLKQMEKIQADYEKSPEKHPHYPEEWKKFWNRRYKELQAEKKVDPNKYDYKPEWIIFWTKRMKDLFNAEVDKKKKEIKVKLGLPEDAEEKVDQLKEKYKVPVNRFSSSNKPTSSRGGQPLDVIDISDDDSPRHSRYPRSRRSRSRSRSPRERGRPRDYRRSRSRSRTRSRSLSPFSDEFDLNSSSKHHVHKKLHNPIRHYNIEHPAEYYPYSRPSRYPPPSAIPPHYQPAGHHYRVLDSSQIPKYQESDSRPTKESIEEPRDEEPEGPLTVVAVLRLLTALEEHLGSLGPKVVDMLGKALALEKVKGNSSDDLLTNEDHCVFFETIKEKLKGLLIADVLEDQQKVKAVKRAIKNIAAIIHQVTTKGPQTETTNKDKDDINADGLSKTKKSPNKNSTGRLSLKDLPFDRQTVATKMAAALVMQGREDVSTADMDKLIYMFILMVKLSKPKREDDGKPLYCNDILPQLGIARNMSKTTSLSLANLPAIVDDLLENEVNALVQEVEDEMENEARENDKESKNDGNSSMLESLTDSDLQTLLQNFKHLSSEEQHHLIAHLKKLESADPSRVEKLRKFVNISDLTGSKEHSSKSSKTSDSTPTKSSTRSKSRFDDSPPSGSKKSRTAAPPGTEDDGDDDNSRRRVNPNKFSLDDDEDDDYNFEDVFKAASSNVNRLSEEHSRQSERNTKSPIVPVSSSPSALTFNPAGLKTSLNDTQNLIANIMGSLQQSNSNSATKSSTSATSATKHIPKTLSSRAAPQPVPPIAAAQLQQQQMPPQQQPNQMAFYQQQQQQQQQQQGYPGPYNQMNAAQANYYNSMGGYNQTPYDGYQQWGHGPQPQMPPQNMQQFGVQGYGMPPQQMGYNMYGQGHN